MPTVLLTPIGLDAKSWSRLSLDGAIMPEYPGHGAAPWDGVQYSLDDLADEVARQTTELLDVIGVSMGGMVAQHLAIRHPGRIRSLFLACTTGACDRSTMLQRAEDADGDMEALLQPTLDRWFGPAPDRPGDSWATSYVARTLRALPPAAFAAGWTAMAGHSVLDQLGSVSVPATCLAAIDDASTPTTALRQLADALPSSRLVMRSGPHMLQLADPVQFSGEVATHLRWVAEREGTLDE